MNQARRKVLTMVREQKLTVDEAEGLLDAISLPEELSQSELPRIELVGESEQMRAYRATLDRIAATHAHALIQGEPGTGKALAARYIHYNSARRNEPFAELNCSQSAVMVESELFGHEEAAFTGAVRARTGLLDSADGGTLMLSDVDALPPETQDKIYRYLQGGSFTRLGGTRQRIADVRLIGICNGDLNAQVAAGRFRPALYQRLKVGLAQTVALRERPGDIAVAAAHFIRMQVERDGRRSISLSDEALRVLMAHDWPGNEAELANTIERAVILCDGDEIRPEHLSGLGEASSR